MATERPSGLLGPDDPAPVSCANPSGRSPFLLTGDHAGRAIPARLGSLGLGDADLTSHIALDTGIAALGAMLSARLDAPFVAQNYSRLVIDCNRDPGHAEAMAGNAGLDDAARARRVREIHEPYHARIAAALAERAERRQETIFIALRSFTPVRGGVPLPWDISVLHEGGDERFARRLLEALAGEPGLMVGDNQPRHPDATDHSLPRHALARGLPYAEIELRQDLIADEAGQRHWTELLTAAFDRARF